MSTKMAICTLKDGKISECNENSIRDLNKDEHMNEVSNLWGKYKKEKTNQICGGGGTTSSTGTSTTSVQSTTSEAATQTPDDIFEEYKITEDDDKKGVLVLVNKLPDNTAITKDIVDDLFTGNNIPKTLQSLSSKQKVTMIKNLKRLLKEQINNPLPTTITTTGNTDADNREQEETTTMGLDDATIATGRKFEEDGAKERMRNSSRLQGRLAKKNAAKANAQIDGGRRRRRGGRKSRRRKSKRRKSKRRKKARKSKRRKSRKKRSKRRKSRRRR